MDNPPGRSRGGTEPPPVRVLYVDDEPSFGELAARFLERTDDRLIVETATDASEGLERLAEADEPFDCVVSDYEMPGRDGIEFLEAVREEYPDLPFVLYTGRGSEEVASDAISAGVTDYLQKGGDTSQYTVLANRIENAVEQYRSKRALEASQQRLSLFIEQSPLGVIEWNEAFEVVRVNDAAEEILGYSQAELVGRSWEAIVPPADRDDVEAVVSELLEDRGGYHSVNENVRRDGERIVCEWHNRVITDEDGITTAFSQFQDVTGRKRRERELERYETLVETVAGGVFAQDAEGRYAYVNTYIEELTGYDRAEVVGERPSEFLPEEDVERIDGGIREMLSGDRETVAFESTLTTATGETVPIEGRLALLPSEEGFNGTVGVVRDITERAERERKLDRLRDRTQALMYAETREETARIATGAADDIIGAPLSGVHFLDDAGDALEPTAVIETVTDTFDHPPRYPRDAEPGSRAALVWGVFESGERLRIDDTHEYEGLTEGTPARSVIVHPVGGHGVFVVSAPEPGAFDDTDEALVELLATSLRTAVDRVEREAKLRHQRNELRRQNERLEAFAGLVSHDLRSPLNVARASLELARREDDTESDHLEAVARSHDRMDALIDDLLALAHERTESTDPEPVVLGELAEGCWRNTVAETRSADLVVETDSTVRADPNRLKQLLENLFRNSLEHGSTSDRLSADNPSEGDQAGVVVRVGDLEDGTGFYVEDDGPGIPQAERERVFEAGYSSTAEGTGLGLSIVEEVASAHDWAVTVTEGADGGARFEITGVRPGDDPAARE